ncbi:hypothetical protein ISS05_01960 [Candidatus Woesearchaeota archaeon]|nr:hypothetical protein [Candidatus Woesearchaeota archaeon]
MKRIFVTLIFILFTLFILSSCSSKGTTNDYEKVTLNAITSNNVNKCEQLTSRDKVVTCFVAYAYGKKKVSVCDKLPDDEKRVCEVRYNDLIN